MTDAIIVAQAAEQDPLSEKYVNAVIRKRGYGHPTAVAARLWQWIGLHGGENGVTLLIYEALQALSQMRAPVADSGTAFDSWWNTQDEGAIRFDLEQYPQDLKATFNNLWNEAWQTALASAPATGEAQPVAWLREMTPGKGIWRRSVSLEEPVTGLAAVDRKTPLYAAPQAGEAARWFGIDLGADGIALIRNAALEQAARLAEDLPGVEGVQAIRALKSQPQADKDGTPCSCPSGDGSLRHPCAVHPAQGTEGGAANG